MRTAERVRRFVAAYSASFLGLLLPDMVWLLLIASEQYQQGIGHLLAPTPNLAAALGFYLLYPLGIVIFAVRPAEDQALWKVSVAGLLFGLFAYATYDLTNLATLDQWPLGLSFLDMGWGSLVSAASATLGKLCVDAMKRRRDRLTPVGPDA